MRRAAQRGDARLEQQPRLEQVERARVVRGQLGARREPLERVGRDERAGARPRLSTPRSASAAIASRTEARPTSSRRASSRSDGSRSPGASRPARTSAASRSAIRS